MQTHYLKTDRQAFQAVKDGIKTHEIRFNDRNFQPGDRLVLQETRYTGAEMREGKPLEYTGHEAVRTISHIQEGYGLAPGWVILSFERKPRIELTAHQLQQALEFIAPDRETDKDQLDASAGIGMFDAVESDGETLPAGMYVWCADYPEEGGQYLQEYPDDPENLLHGDGRLPLGLEIRNAMEQFRKWFACNYPGPDTIIHDPNWHAPMIFRAMRNCMLRNHQPKKGIENE